MTTTIADSLPGCDRGSTSRRRRTAAVALVTLLPLASACGTPDQRDAVRTAVDFYKATDRLLGNLEAGPFHEADALAAGDEQDPERRYLHRYPFAAMSGARVAVTLESEAFDTYLRLEGPDGFRLDDDDGGSGTNSELDAELPAAGVYWVTVTSVDAEETGGYELQLASAEAGANETGTYELVVASAEAADDDAVLLGHLADGPFRQSAALTAEDERDPDRGYRRRYRFTADAGAHVAVSLESDAFDTYLSLDGPDGFRLEDDDGGSGTNSEIDAELPAAGVYRITATSRNTSQTGSYELTLAADDVAPTEEGQTGIGLTERRLFGYPALALRMLGRARVLALAGERDGYQVEIPFWVRGRNAEGAEVKQRRTLRVDVAADGAAPTGWAVSAFTLTDPEPLTRVRQFFTWLGWVIVTRLLLLWAIGIFALGFLWPKGATVVGGLSALPVHAYVSYLCWGSTGGAVIAMGVLMIASLITASIRRAVSET